MLFESPQPPGELGRIGVCFSEAVLQGFPDECVPEANSNSSSYSLPPLKKGWGGVKETLNVGALGN